MEEQNLIEEFREAMRTAGLPYDGPIVPFDPSGPARGHRGERFHVEGDAPGSENGWYILHLDDFPTAQFGTWKDPDTRHTWIAKTNRRLTPDEKRAREKRIAEQRALREEQERKAHEEAAAKASELWESLAPAPDGHDYLRRKQVGAHNLRVSNGALVVPLRSIDGKLWSLQFISTGGDKRYLTDGRKRGCYSTLKKQGKGLEVAIIAEGYATAATIHEATGEAVLVAFDAQNLRHVATALRQKYPKLRIVIAADNDRWTLKPVENPGVTYARQAAEAARAELVIPEFKVLDGTKPTDFNDLQNREGVEAVRRAFSFLEAKEPEPEPAAPTLVRDDSGGFVEEGKRPKQTVGGFPLVIPWAYTNRNGRPLANIENMRVLLDSCDIEVRYNVIKKDLEIKVPNESYLVDTQRNNKLTRILSICSTVGLQTKSIVDYVDFLAGQTPYNPVEEWVTSVPWDKRSRLEEFYATIKGKHDENPERFALKTTLLKRWLVQAIAVAFSPRPISTYGVLVFQGDQHVGKTHWFKKLVPQNLNLAKDGLTLKPDDKDSVLQAVSFWLVELGELDSTFKKSEISSLKAFITNENDIVRPPYARTANEYQRRTVFFGSVNDEEFLADPTGNRRFWTIPVSGIDYGHTIDMQQLWAEVLELWKSGEPYYLQPEELAALNKSNKDFELTNPVEELIRARYKWEAATTYRELTASEIAKEIGIGSPKQSDTRAIAKAVRTISGHDYIRKTHGKYFKVPHLPKEGGGLFG